YGLVSDGNGGYILTQTPVVKTSQEFKKLKKQIYSGVNEQITSESENILKDLNTHCFELEASVQNPEKAAVYFRINMNGSEYTEIGWNATDGYYVDRTHAGDAGLNLGNYRRRYSKQSGDGTELNFYILSDNSGVEVYCDNFTVPFYVLTFSSPYATKAEFFAEGDVTATVTVNEISSTWRKEAQDGETVLYLGAEEITLDRALTCEKEVMAYSTAGGEIEWAVESGENVAGVEKTEGGAKIKSLSAGKAVIAVTCGSVTKKINVTVVSGSVDSDVEFAPEGKISGDWFLTDGGLQGVQSSGDGFILSGKTAADFTYAATFKLEGAAAALVFRAERGTDGYLSKYLVANYDNNGKIVKLWSQSREYGNVNVGGQNTDKMLLKVAAYGNNVKVYLNGNEVINATLDEGEPTEGLLGLNSCAATTTFSSVVLVKNDYEYAGSGNLVISGETEQHINAIYNNTLGNVKINGGFYKENGRRVELGEDYFKTIPQTGVYRLTVKGATIVYEISVNVTAIPVFTAADLYIDEGCNAVINAGASSLGAVTLLSL
ncbi:MAG: GH32 C-terminal domain-containing protein, partial [Clostridia bacterium]|nr:GH32 C-terminal domain-containing protein [Clostridia bacterium]